jgi:hypothetical protein
MKISNTACAVALAIALGAAGYAKADDTFVYAVQISAVVQSNPPQIRLNWEPDPYGAKSYAIYRKAKTATAWGDPIATLNGSFTNYADLNVIVGSNYEYQIYKVATLGYTGFGYIYSGIQAPFTEDRGTLILVVATNSAPDLSNELARLQTDLICDGWSVIRQDVSSNDTPESVREDIMDYYRADPGDVDAVFLFGHVPILQSGYLNYDGHYTRAMPADAFYGEMNDDWPTDVPPTNRPSYLPSDVALMVGRVDMFNMPGMGAAVPWPSEEELLRNYLDKDHNWRNHLISVDRRALMGDRRGSDDGALAMAASGYRIFEPCVGPGNTIQADILDNAPVDQSWIYMLSTGSYLWAFGDGGGELNSISYLGTNPPYQTVLSTDIVGDNAQGVFVLLFGSFFGNWDDQDDIMRSVLATPTTGLACVMSGEPHWFLHHMGLGETIGYGTRLTMNNSTLYRNMSNIFTRAVYIALMGDPTLRMEPLAPPESVSGASGPGGVVLNWGASADPVLGYHVYRATSPAGPFSRLTSTWVAGNTYLDNGVTQNTYTYMVRAVTLQTNPSGSYYNLSEGALATVTYAPLPASINVTISMATGAPTLTWNSISGAVYHVISATNMMQSAWLNVSGPLTAAGANTTWTDIGSDPKLPCFYRVVSP